LSNWTAYPQLSKPVKLRSKVPDTDLNERLHEIYWKHTGRSQNHNTAIRPNFWPGGASIIDKKISLLALIILVLTVHWLLSFFGQSIVPGIPHTGGFIDMLSIMIVVLIIVKFLS
jgi:hypothetical protein